MRILFVADGRSPTAINWMRHFVDMGHEVHLASTFRAEPELELASLHFVPVAFSERAGSESGGDSLAKSVSSIQVRTKLRQWLGPLTLSRAAHRLREVANTVQPELVHALRIPFEGMLTAEAGLTAPMIISVWGNDFTLHAGSSPLMRNATRKATCRTDALLSDTRRDQKLSWEWGFDPAKPNMVLPGGGGIRKEIFYPANGKTDRKPIVINPRGLRAYVRNDLFFKAIPKVLKKFPEAEFICPAMEGMAEAEKWVRDLGIKESVRLLPKLAQSEMAEQYRSAQVMVSPSEHDGTPNSLLEAMASGLFPVAGDIESAREWIDDGENGLLVALENADELAQGMIRALRDRKLRKRAKKTNLQLIAERAEYGAVMTKAEEFYGKVISSHFKES